MREGGFAAVAVGDAENTKVCFDAPLLISILK